MKKKAFLARICLLPLALAVPAQLWGQASSSDSAAVAKSDDDDPAALLAENLKALARDPYNVDALLAAGSGALAVGDANAAFGFFARAEELSPANWRAKAGLGSSLTMMERAKDALRAFDEAAGLGAPEQALAADRGLAHDLDGDGKKAQKDYQTALRSSPSDEVTRRYALSQGIEGEKEAALARLDPLVRRNDQGAWRARAFILAMNGDLPGAERIVRMVAPPESASTMLGFMQRLSGLNPSAKAHAVHFGTLPGSGQLAGLEEEDGGFSPLDQTAAARLETTDSGARTSVASAAEARRFGRQDRELMRLAERGRRASEPSGSAATTAPLAASSSPVAQASAPSQQQVATVPAAAAARPVNSPQTSSSAAIFGPPAPGDSIPAGSSAASKPAETTQVAAKDLPPLFEVPAAQPRPATPSPTGASAARPMTAQGGPEKNVPDTASRPALTEAAVSKPVAPRFALADVVRTLELEEETRPIALPDEARLKALRIAAQKKAAAEEKARAEKAEAERRAAEEAAKIRRNPARVWVQIATGGNMAGLPGTWRSIKAQAPKTLDGMKAWYVPFRQTNRIVVGPIKSTSEARSIVNKLFKEGVVATVFSSDPGQEVERIGGK